MDRLHINQTGGFPLTTNILNALQNAYNLFNNLGHVVGNLSIISGCEQVGSTISDGVVFVDGELYPFQGGSIGATVFIKEDVEQRSFEDGSTKDVLFKRYVKFGSSTTNYNWSDFKRYQPLSSALFIDEIRMFAGDLTTLPEGWYFCDGTNGTEDLRGRFIVGRNPNDSDYNQVGETGGSKTLTPTGTISSRSLSLSIPRDGWGTSGGVIGSAPSGRLIVGSGATEIGEALESIRAAANNRSISSTHNHDFNGTAKDNRPPYYTLAYIQYKGI